MANSKRQKFLLDENLNKLAKWLRILGYDAAIYKNISFLQRANLTKKERRIYLTRSKKESKSHLVFSRILLKSDDYLQQIKELRELLHYDENEMFLRCTKCNRKLYYIDKERVSGKIPQRVFAHFTTFYVCRKCGNFYWKGSHFVVLKKKLEKIFL
ncbi:MAG: hypothetical protein HN952_02555 [Candidatus Cloacimonetes bacterium]|nr:hypothetical protein [Candidatus Cloacimonadota bacterium]